MLFETDVAPSSSASSHWVGLHFAIEFFQRPNWRTTYESMILSNPHRTKLFWMLGPNIDVVQVRGRWRCRLLVSRHANKKISEQCVSPSHARELFCALLQAEMCVTTLPLACVGSQKWRCDILAMEHLFEVHMTRQHELQMIQCCPHLKIEEVSWLAWSPVFWINTTSRIGHWRQVKI